MQVTRSAHAIGSGSMPASADHRRDAGQPRRATQRLVEPVLEADHAGRDRRRRQHRSRHRPSPTPTSTTVPSTGPRTPAQAAHPAGEQPLHDRVGRAVLGGVLAGGLERARPGARPIGRPLGRRTGASSTSRRPRSPVGRRSRAMRAAPQVHDQLGRAGRAAPSARRPPRAARRPAAPGRVPIWLPAMRSTSIQPSSADADEPDDRSRCRRTGGTAGRCRW